LLGNRNEGRVGKKEGKKIGRKIMDRFKTLVLSSFEYLMLYLCRYNLPPVLPILMIFFQMSHGDVGTLA
jgi:hypothetical protein